MAPLTKLKIPILVILAFLAMPAFVPSSSVDLQNTSKISYNAPEGDIVHAPLSGMGLITIALMRNLTATPDFFKITTVGSTAPGGSSNSQTGLKTIRQNALRFVNDTSYLPQTETAVAVDPANTKHVVGAFNDMKFLFCSILQPECFRTGFPMSVSGFTISADGGTSIMKGSDLPQLIEQSTLISMIPFGDPTVVPGTDGNFFYGTLAANRFGGNGVILAKSNSSLFDPAVSCISAFDNPNANSCWTEILLYGSPFFSGGLEDKPVIAVDRSRSPYSGSVYVAWNHFDLFIGTTSTYLVRCSGDLSSCALLAGGSLAPLSGSDRFADFATPVVDAKGNVYVTWCNYGTSSTFGPIDCRVRSSAPGGENFTPPTTILSFMGFGTVLPNYSFVQGFATEQFRTASIPFLAVDASSKPSSGYLYFAIQICTSGRYIDLRSPAFGLDNPGLCGLSSIVFSRSTDGGASWSTPAIVSDPAANVQPYITVDVVTGHLFILYYTTKFDPFNHRIDVVALISTTTGTIFHENRVTSVSNEPDSDPNMDFYVGGFGGSWTVPQYGDYFEATAVGGTVWVLFTGNYAVEEGTFQTDPFLATFQG